MRGLMICDLLCNFKLWIGIAGMRSAIVFTLIVKLHITYFTNPMITITTCMFLPEAAPDFIADQYIGLQTRYFNNTPSKQILKHSH